MKAKFVWSSYKTGAQKYAVVMDDGRKGFLKFGSPVCKYAKIGDEGVLVQTKQGTKFILNSEPFDIVEWSELEFPMVVFEPEPELTEKVSSIDKVSEVSYSLSTPPPSAEIIGDTQMNEVNENTDVTENTAQSDASVETAVENVTAEPTVENEPNDSAAVDGAGEAAPQKKRGRPVDPNSPLQQAYALYNELVATGSSGKDVVAAISARITGKNGEPVPKPTASTYCQLAKNPEKNPGATAALAARKAIKAGGTA